MKNQEKIRLPFWIAILLVVFNFSSQNLFGQAKEGSETKLTLSDPLEGKIKEPFIAGSDDKTVFLFNGYHREGDIHILDASTLKVRAVVDQAILTDKPILQRGFYYSLSYLMLNGNLYIFSNYYDWNVKKLFVYGSILDSNGKIILKDKELFSISKSTFKPLTVINYSVNELNNISICVKSPMHEALFLKKFDEELQLVLFNQNLEKVSGVVVNNNDLFKEKQGTTFGPYYVNNDDISMIYLFREEPKSKSVNSITTLYAYNKLGKVQFSQELNTNEPYLDYFTFFRENNKLRFLAYYSNGEYMGFGGSIVFDYNPKSGRFEEKIKNVYSDDLKSNFLSSKDIKNGLGIRKFSFSSILRNNKDNSKTVINEFAEYYLPLLSSDVEYTYYQTGNSQLIEKYDPTGKLVDAYVVNSPNIKKGIDYHARFKWNTSNESLYFVSKTKDIDKKSRELIKDFDLSSEFGVFTIDVNEKSKPNQCTQIKLPLNNEAKLTFMAPYSSYQEPFVLKTSVILNLDDNIVFLNPTSVSPKIGFIIKESGNGSVYKFGYLNLSKE